MRDKQTFQQFLKNGTDCQHSDCKSILSKLSELSSSSKSGLIHSVLMDNPAMTYSRTTNMVRRMLELKCIKTEQNGEGYTRLSVSPKGQVLLSHSKEV